MAGKRVYISCPVEDGALRDTLAAALDAWGYELTAVGRFWHRFCDSLWSKDTTTEGRLYHA